jgi:hypothetical protein
MSSKLKQNRVKGKSSKPRFNERSILKAIRLAMTLGVVVPVATIVLPPRLAVAELFPECAVIGSTTIYNSCFVSNLTIDNSSIVVMKAPALYNFGPLNNNGILLNYSKIYSGGIINNNRTFSNEGGSTLTNNGTINNSVFIKSRGLINGTGTLNNQGLLLVYGTGDVQIQNSSNFSGGTLTGGRWDVYGGGKLSFGAGPITTLAKNTSVIVKDGDVTS